RGLVPYAYDPASDELEPPDEEDMLHDPDDKAWSESDISLLFSGGGKRHPGLKRAFPWRGILNVAVLIILILALLCLFIFYPVLTFYQNSARNLKIDGNIRINATGQAPVLFQMPDLIDKDTPDAAKSRTGFDGHEYELVFSDEFNVDGRSFYPGDDPFWEAVDLWYGVTGDIEWYDPSQVTTRNGNLVITMDSIETTVPGQTVGNGYIEVSVVLPGANENAQGYWPGAWTMGNLGRPGYPGSTDGTWPYT
ncbi:glycoside hydrolase family 16 protein, partial [Pleurotus ostreatus PC15]